MDRITLPNEKTYDAAFAADVVGSNRWTALLESDNLPEIVTDFDGVDRITVENDLTGVHVYEGYTRLIELHRTGSGVQIVLEKEAVT